MVSEAHALRRLIKKMPAAEVAKRLGRSERAIYHQCARMGIKAMKRGMASPAAKYSDAQVAEVLALFATGKWPPSRIAEIHPMRLCTIERYCYGNLVRHELLKNKPNDRSPIQP